MRRMYSLNQLEELANARVKALVEGGTLDNAKPIYYHPISIYNTTRGNISFLILDNNSVAYTKETLIAKIANFARISPLSGCVLDSVTNKHIVIAYGWQPQGQTYHVLMGTTLDGVVITSSTGGNTMEDYINDNGSVVSDGVNKIN